MAKREERDDADDELPEARVVEKGKRVDDFAWTRRGIFLGVLVVGWVFIAWANRFYWTAPMVMLCIGFFAVCSTVYALWRTGVTVVADDDEDGVDSTWGRPIGKRGELEREKRTLLKAIKEAEFDREMGKLSKKDADEMIAVYRLRAIEVIKELDKLDDIVGAPALTKRQQIEREIKARLELDKTTGKKKNKKKKVEADAATEAPVVEEKDEEPEHAAHDSTVAPEAEPEVKEAAQ